MQIVVLDDIGMGAADIRRLEDKGEVRICSGTPSGDAEIVERARAADIVISGWTKISDDVLAELPGLKLISLWATGLDNVDLAAASARRVVVCHVPSYATNAVAELALGLMLAVMRKIPAADQHLRRTCLPEWQPFQGGELCGKTLGVVGTGVIGRRVARLGQCLGMSLLGYDVQPSQALIDDVGMRYVRLAELFAKSDVVTLHAPLTPQTHGLVDGALLRRLPATAVIVNTARAGLIRQDDLLEVLSENAIAGAGLDVIDLERESGPKLLALDNVVATPHIGFYTQEALDRLTAVCVENVIRFLDGRPVNVAAPPKEDHGV
jgi:D-3-phosphoglycerate dehydrogenase